MSLPQAAISFLNDNAAINGAAPPQDADDLFQLGALDSFALVDFVTVLEEHSGIRVPDRDVTAETFRTIEAIERYVAARTKRADGRQYHRLWRLFAGSCRHERRAGRDTGPQT